MRLPPGERSKVTRMRVISFVGMIAGAVALVSASGAATRARPAGATIDLSSKAKVHQYLRSIHVNPKGVVIQRGLRNYAGAHCPGKRWTCARTRHTVVQIAKRGGQNRFVCKSSKCVVVQISGTSHGVYASGRRLASTAAPNKGGGNSGVCLKNGSGSTTGTGQICQIIQTGSGPNTAVIWENSQKVSGLNTSLMFTAEITQTATGASQENKACVTQAINLDGSTTGTKGKAVTAALEAHQRVTITQDSSSGPNTATKAAVLSGSTAVCDTSSNALAQSQTLTSTVNATASITQNQNAATNYTDPITHLRAANVVLDIEQNQASGFKGSASGLNNAVFTQTTNQVAIANTPNGKVIQQQNADVPNPPYSGMVGTINQDSSAKSTAVVNQTETQCEDAVNQPLPPPQPGQPPTCPVDNDLGVPAGVDLTQTQWGPEGVLPPSAKGAGRVPFFRKGYGESKQTGAGANVVDSFNLTQTSHQYADQTSGQHQLIQGDCASSGNSSPSGGSCQASQTATLNGQDTQDGYTAGTIAALIINCTSGHSSCTATPPPVPVLTVTPDDPSEDTSPTFEWTEGGSGATAGISFDCSIDSGDPVSCDSGDTSPVGLGDHTFEVTASDNFGNTSDPASFAWTVVPYLTFEATADGASAGWTDDVPGSSITLKVGSVPATTFGQFTLHNFEGIAIDDLAEPTFMTGTYSGGAPREEIDFSNGDYVFGYPSQAGFGTDSWQLVCDGGCVTGGFMSWADVQAAEPADTTVVAALVEADGGVPDGTTFVISAFTFDGYSLSDFTDHWH
jgi:hypothetical protein